MDHRQPEAVERGDDRQQHRVGVRRDEADRDVAADDQRGQPAAVADDVGGHRALGAEADRGVGADADDQAQDQQEQLGAPAAAVHELHAARPRCTALTGSSRTRARRAVRGGSWRRVAVVGRRRGRAGGRGAAGVRWSGWRSGRSWPSASAGGARRARRLLVAVPDGCRRRRARCRGRRGARRRALQPGHDAAGVRRGCSAPMPSRTWPWVKSGRSAIVTLARLGDVVELDHRACRPGRPGDRDLVAVRRRRSTASGSRRRRPSAASRRPGHRAQRAPGSGAAT